jgi:hypothetical protein
MGIVFCYLWNNGSYHIPDKNIKDFIIENKDSPKYISLPNVPQQINEILNGSLVYEPEMRQQMDYFTKQINHLFLS